jgi:hypothetical protein
MAALTRCFMTVSSINDELTKKQKYKHVSVFFRLILLLHCFTTLSWISVACSPRFIL